MFGLVWPAGLALADSMSRLTFDGKRILEVGCGLGLSSLVLRRAGADITATDHHPLAGEFLSMNAALNRLGPIAFRRASWSERDPALGRFDVIVASDVLYERQHPDELLRFFDRHTNADAQVIVADPGRAQHGRFSARMRADGYAQSSERVLFPGGSPTRRGHIMSFARASDDAVAMPAPPSTVAR